MQKIAFNSISKAFFFSVRFKHQTLIHSGTADEQIDAGDEKTIKTDVKNGTGVVVVSEICKILVKETTF